MRFAAFAVVLLALGCKPEEEFALECGALATVNEPDAAFLDGDAVCGAILGAGDVDSWQAVNETGAEADLVLTFDTFYAAEASTMISCPAELVISQSPGILEAQSSCTSVRLSPVPDGALVTFTLRGPDGEYLFTANFEPR